MKHKTSNLAGRAPRILGSLLALLASSGPIHSAFAVAPQDPQFSETFLFGYQSGGITSSAWGDFDGDGFLDVALQGSNSYVTLYRNNRDRTFSRYLEFLQGSTGGYKGLDWADFDADGDLDLAVGSFYPGQNFLYVNQGGSFTQVPEFGGGTFQNVDLEWGDCDNDGDPDMAVANNTSQNYLYVNDGDGSFTPTVQFGSRANRFGWGDFDNDGDLDLAATSSSDSITFLPNRLYVNNGDCTFQETLQFGISRHSTSLAWGDYDGDGDLDLALGNQNPYGNSNPQNYLYINHGDGTFTASPQFGSYGQDLAWGDYDLDGDLDLAVGSSLGNRLYANNGDGTFTELSAFGSFGRNVSWGDYDNDGDLDLLTRDSLYTNQMVHNLPPVAVCQDATVTAGASCTAAFAFTGSYDPDGDPLSAGQEPASPYPLGSTAVKLTVTDNLGASASCSATVTVVDATPPAISCPADRSVQLGLGESSVVLDYPLASAGDSCSAAAVACSPPPGSTFQIGSTSVTCSATDTAGNSAACSFGVTVLTPQGAAQTLAGGVDQLVTQGALGAGAANALVSKLDAAVAQLDAGKVQAAINQLRAFINQVEALIASGDLTPAQGQPLIDAAEAILQSLNA